MRPDVPVTGTIPSWEQPGAPEPLPQRVRVAIDDALAHAPWRVVAAFVRDPPIDSATPESSDIDLLVFADVRHRGPWRHHPTASAGGLGGLPTVDVLCLPRADLRDHEGFARNGLTAHRLLTARVAVDADGCAEDRDAVRDCMWHHDIQRDRSAGFLRMAQLAVREIGVTWDFPALALFWLHVAYAACLAATVDAQGGLCPNVYTRPLDVLATYDALAAGEGTVRCGMLVEQLRLETDASALIEPLRRLYRAVTHRCPEPVWPDVVREATRTEYRYVASADELEFRIAVAMEMVRRHAGPAATYYIRFWAYALARIPMVHACAQEERDVPFLRPERAIRRFLAEQCPEVIDDLAEILGGSSLLADDVHRALSPFADAHRRTLQAVADAGITLPPLPPCVPFGLPP